MIEKYAFITNENHTLHVTGKWPDAISVGNNYKMVQFADINEAQLEQWVNELGYQCKDLDAPTMIAEMEQLKEGPFNSNHADAVTVVNHFRPPQEEF